MRDNLEFNRYVPKGWGYERWIVNGPKYCGKVLFFIKGKKNSVHKHILKDECFWVRNGSIELRIYSCPDNLEYYYSVLMRKGDIHHIPSDTVHNMIALEDSEIIEFSTEHKEEDVISLIKGD